MGEIINEKGTVKTTVDKRINQAKELIVEILAVAKAEEIRCMQTKSPCSL